MAVTLRWLIDEELDRVADCRALCYSPASKEMPLQRRRIREDVRGRPGDYCLAERDGVAVGTTTSLSSQMRVRGRSLPCQGVAWVGTIKTQRRGGKGSERGIASQLMHESLRQAREREEVVSALMPFRASYYEHFGYGLVERRMEWTLPLAVLPPGEFEGMRFVQEGDVPLIAACHAAAMEAGQCEWERPLASWPYFTAQWGDGYVVVDQTRGGAIESWMYFTEATEAGRSVLRVIDAAHISFAALKRQLHFLHSLRDQHSVVVYSLPRDVPLNWLLRETQLPHRIVEHPTARAQPVTRLQLRVLDHVRFLQGQVLQADFSGRAIVCVKECEGGSSTFEIDIDRGRVASRASSKTPDVTLPDKLWGTIACGEVPASTFAQMGLLEAAQPLALPTLDAFGFGPAPFCNERF